MKKIKDTGIIVNQTEISENIFSMTVETAIADLAAPGQFVNLFTKDGAKLLPRPISICRIKKSDRTIRFVYRIAGEGTRDFSKMRHGDEIELIGPVGNGFPLDLISPDKKVLLIGGGIGVPPMVGVAEALKYAGVKPANIISVMGYRNSDTFLEDELREVSTLYIASDDGSIGVEGTVIDAINEYNLTADYIFACGPKPMLRGLKEFGLEKNIPCYISMEERMACGIGACLACVCESADIDEHSQVKNKRVCVDGPVFLSTEVTL